MERLWDANKGKNDNKSLSQNLDYLSKLTSQLDYLRESPDGVTRIAYTASGEPTAALVTDDKAILDTKLYQVACRSREEAYYLLAIINSNTLAREVKPFCTTNWSRKIRDLHKHLWKLPIPRYDAGDELHGRLSELGESAEGEANALIRKITKDGSIQISSQAARSILRHDWQPASKTASSVETAVTTLLNPTPSPAPHITSPVKGEG